jgi:hypothetical protein
VAPRPVYSTQFVDLPAFSGGPFPAYAVPAGKLAVVKDMRIVFGEVTISGVDAWFQDNALTKLWRYAWFVSLGSPTNHGGTSAWWGMAVLNAGDVLQVQTAAGTVDFSASGYLLDLP